ncbi:DUF4145 domain-containing protein [Campylobacter lari]|uniref:DUF4145 domain-containing protein n=1 Tax=Campylobacter lari TaxID=201 RepID=A0A7U8ARF7_CAMLA|nr:DUF4145 domain-containing protein [Campylobacter lari]
MLKRNKVTMNIKYHPPVYESLAFNCPHCNAYTSMEWQYHCVNYIVGTQIATSKCFHCDNFSVWLVDDEKMIYPKKTNIPLPNENLSKQIKQIYNEAASILDDSPKAACALMRLALQELMKELGKTKENLAESISSLKNQGFEDYIIQACETVRIVGNNAVHPGTINIDDNPEIAHCLFEMINLIADKLITHKVNAEKFYKKIQNLNQKTSS